ncbi:hypothetical protein [Skermanella aerolata]|nr:hypothetical protein [Skermanella aerolata]
MRLDELSAIGSSTVPIALSLLAIAQGLQPLIFGLVQVLKVRQELLD